MLLPCVAAKRTRTVVPPAAPPYAAPLRPNCRHQEYAGLDILSDAEAAEVLVMLRGGVGVG